MNSPRIGDFPFSTPNSIPTITTILSPLNDEKIKSLEKKIEALIKENEELKKEKSMEKILCQWFSVTEILPLPQEEVIIRFETEGYDWYISGLIDTEDFISDLGIFKVTCFEHQDKSLSKGTPTHWCRIPSALKKLHITEN